jgi:hypothetical protein
MIRLGMKWELNYVLIYYLFVFNRSPFFAMGKI